MLNYSVNFDWRTMNNISQKKYGYITRPVMVLSMVSLFTDMASEMLYPVMPVFLASIGFSVFLIGLLEGFVEMLAGIGKGYFGQLSDMRQQRVPFVRWGYILSAVSKPMLALSTSAIWIFFSRSVDRTGKGLRTSPRDALLSSQTTPENKAKVFGFPRGMDTLGAVIGPSIALLFLWMQPGDYNQLFLLAFIPGAAAVIFTFRLKEKKGTPSQKKIHLFSYLSYFRSAPKGYNRLVTGLIVFALVNSSDVLLMLKMKEAKMADTAIIGVYIFYNLVYALSAFPIGMLADKFGMKKIFIIGLLLFVIVYAGFAVNDEPVIFLVLFFIYGLYAAATEGIAKAWISNLAPARETGTAIGAYASLSSIAAFIASTSAGALWYGFGAPVAFGFTAAVTAVVAVYLSTLRYSAVSSTSADN